MNVHLGDTFDAYVREQLASGRYNNASEVIREALRLKMREDEERAAKLEALRSDIKQAREQVRKGKVVKTSLEEFKSRRRKSSNG